MQDTVIAPQPPATTCPNFLARYDVDLSAGDLMFGGRVAAVQHVHAQRTSTEAAATASLTALHLVQAVGPAGATEPAPEPSPTPGPAPVPELPPAPTPAGPVTCGNSAVSLGQHSAVGSGSPLATLTSASEPLLAGSSASPDCSGAARVVGGADDPGSQPD